VVLGLAGFSYWIAWRALPDLDGIVGIGELSEPVRVRFDQWAVPYIAARSQKDLNISQGYVTASDRMFQMDILRRAARGQLSEVFGASCLAHDKLVRTIGFNRMAAQQYKKISPECKNDLRAYTEGVNAYISQSSAKPGLEFLLLGYRPRPWEPEDSIAILKFLEYQLDESWRLDEFRTRLVNKVGIKLASALFDQPLAQKNVSTTYAPISNFAERVGQLIIKPLRTWGSSGWAISGQISSTHGCLLACDKHGPFICPDLWYSCELTAPEFHVAGATIPGVPGVIYGRNNNIAWSANSLKADVQDLFVEQFSDKFPSKYRVTTGWATADELTEEIAQRFGPNVLEKIDFTRHGPVLFRNDAVAVSLSWTGFNEKGSSLETIRNLNKAKDWADFRNALKTYGGSPNTFIFADTKGNIGMQVSGAIPIRQSGAASSGVVYSSAPTVLPGATDDCKWAGQVKFEDLPSAFNAPDGFVIANDSKTGIPLDSNPVLPRRARDVLTQYRKTSQHPDLPEMSALQFDQQAYLLPLVKSEVGKAISHTGDTDAFAQEGLQLLGQSNGQLRGDSASSAIYESFLVTILRRTLGQKLDPNLLKEYVERCPSWSNFVGHILKDKPHDMLPSEERDYESFILTSFAESIKDVRLALKSDDSKHWNWKTLHQIDFLKGTERFTVTLPEFVASILSPQKIGVGGDQDCINNCNYELDGLPTAFNCTSGPTVRTLIDMSDEDKFYQTLSLGQSEHLLSSHRTDQLRSWLDGELHPIAFSEKQLEKQLQHTLILSNRTE